MDDDVKPAYVSATPSTPVAAGPFQTLRLAMGRAFYGTNGQAAEPSQARETTLSQHSDAPEKDSRSCGLAVGANVYDPQTAVEFGRVLQEMIRQCLSAPNSIRIRIFDDHTIPFEVSPGVNASFTSCRLTQFRRLRNVAGLSEEQYVDSLCAHPFLGGKTEAAGKSGSFFLKSHDQRFVVKTIEDHEFDVLRDILSNYVLYLEEHPKSLLCRFYGAYSLEISGKTLRFIVMANVLPQSTSEIYDLKGTSEDRWADPSVHTVLKDNNFVPYTMLLESEMEKDIRRRIRDDAEFLESVGIMDYSMLLGVTKLEDVDASSALEALPGSGTFTLKGWLCHRNGNGAAVEERLFQVGIIDYLQRWTPSKIAAHWLKKPTLGCCHEIDTEPPAVYSARFFKYFRRKIQAKDPLASPGPCRI